MQFKARGELLLIFARIHLYYSHEGSKAWVTYLKTYVREDPPQGDDHSDSSWLAMMAMLV